MNILTKSSYDFLSGQEMKKMDGLIALLFYVYIIFITCIGFILLKNGLLDHYPKELSKIIFGTVMLLMMLIPLFVILKVRNQDITTIGFTRFRLRRSIVISLVLILTYLVYFIIHYGLSITLFYKLYVYIITVGFFEEIMFRGYIWRVSALEQSLVVFYSASLMHL